jgi:hypothetical protein
MINESEAISISETTKIRISEEYYLRFCNQTEKNENRAERAVFETDWKRFMWAFVLGINAEKRTPIKKGEKTYSPFGFDVFKNHYKMFQLVIALCLQEMYKDDPSKLKKDYEKASQNKENLGTNIRIAMEEYANTGFALMRYKADTIPGYIENIDEIVRDILSDE